MHERPYTTFRLLGLCTLRGGFYGLVAGTITGLCMMLWGVILGAPIGGVLGLAFGLVNGLAIRWFVPYGRGTLNVDEYRRQLTICCLATSVIFDAFLVAIDITQLQTYYLTYGGLFGIPGILISANLLAKYVARWYAEQVEIAETAYVVDSASDVWPPAPHRR